MGSSPSRSQPRMLEPVRSSHVKALLCERGLVKRRLALILAVAAAAFGGAAVAPATDSGALTEAASAHTCSRGKHAIIDGAHKCLARGQFCGISRDREYHRYGFHCHRSSRDSGGRYHLT